MTLEEFARIVDEQVRAVMPAAVAAETTFDFLDETNAIGTRKTEATWTRRGNSVVFVGMSPTGAIAGVRGAEHTQVQPPSLERLIRVSEDGVDHAIAWVRWLEAPNG